MNRHHAHSALPAICAAIAFSFWNSVACAQDDDPRSAAVETQVTETQVTETQVAETSVTETSLTDSPSAETLPMEQLIPRDQLSPVVAEIFAALDEERARIRQLKNELAATNDPARAFELQRAIVAAKQEAELRMLSIQADHARRENRADVAAELDGAIQTLTTPAIGREPEPRAASAAGR